MMVGFMKRIAILGSTGSIGRSTLRIVESYPDRFSVVALAAGSNYKLALEDAKRWQPKIISLAHAEDAAKLQSELKQSALHHIQVVHSAAGTVQVATHPEADFVVSAIVGVAGLEATYEAVKAGKSVGLANKECLVCAGSLFMRGDSSEPTTWAWLALGLLAAVIATRSFARGVFAEAEITARRSARAR